MYDFLAESIVISKSLDLIQCNRKLKKKIFIQVIERVNGFKKIFISRLI